MIEPISAFCVAALTQIAGSFTIGTAAGGIIGNRSDALFSNLMGQTVDHFAKQIRLPANHDLLKAIVGAHSKALAYAAESMSRQARDGRERDIADKIVAIAKRATTPDADVSTALQAMVTPLLAGPSDAASDARRQTLFNTATTTLIAWLEAESRETLPAHFAAVLTAPSPNGRASWLEVLQLYVAEEMRTNPRFGQMFLAETVNELVGRTITIQTLAEDLTRGMDGLRGDLGLVASDVKAVRDTQQIHGDQLAELLALARQGGIFQQAGAQGISEAAVRAIVERLGGEGVGKDDLLSWLEGWIETAKDALGRHSNEGEAFEAARAEAERRFLAGQAARASDPFMALLEREQAETKRRQTAILEEAIRFDKLALNVAGVIEKMRLLADASGAVDPDARGSFFSAQAKQHYQLGDERGDNFALLIAIEGYRLTLKERTLERVPLDWARTQVNLANALLILGERESGTARLEQAVVAYHLALEELTRERVPLDWAKTQANLAIAFMTLGERESGTDRLEQAVVVYRLALEERTRERVPLDWARTQMNLATVLWRLGERESGTARLEQAVFVCRLALEEQTRERVPLQWALTQMNLASALLRLGERESGTARLQEVVVAYRLALEELTRERVPLQWALTQMGLASALMRLGERERGTARLEEAVFANRLALEEQTRERVPLDWARTQANLGDTLCILGRRENATVRLEEAVALYHQALKEFTRERIPLLWAMTQLNLAEALTALGERKGDVKLLDDAQAIIDEARQVALGGGHEPLVTFADGLIVTLHEIRTGLG